MKIFYNSFLAKTFLFKGYSTIMLFGFVFTKYKKENLSKRIVTHERVHQLQYWECFLIWTILGCLLSIFLNNGLFFLILGIFGFYIQYLIEYIIRFTHYLFTEKLNLNQISYKAYKEITLEREANYYEDLYREGGFTIDPKSFLERTRYPFDFLRFYNKNNKWV